VVLLDAFQSIILLAVACRQLHTGRPASGRSVGISISMVRTLKAAREPLGPQCPSKALPSTGVAA
jgi:hypothetical protein